MPEILNKEKSVEKIIGIIEHAKKEVILITPYIKLTDELYQQLSTANRKGIEIIVVYRENKLNEVEKDKLAKFDNLTLMHHPELHAKCYLNESELVISSLNLFEYSFKNTRELGVYVLNQKDINGNNLYSDTLDEVRLIIGTSTIEKKSLTISAKGFEIHILKTEKALLELPLREIKKSFINKDFQIIQTGKDFQIQSLEYADKIGVQLNHYYDEGGKYMLVRVEIRAYFPESLLKKVFENFKTVYNEFMISGFKIYWNSHLTSVLIYRDSKIANTWDDLDLFQTCEKFKIGIDKIIKQLLELKKKVDK